MTWNTAGIKSYSSEICENTVATEKDKVLTQSRIMSYWLVLLLICLGGYNIMFKDCHASDVFIL